MVLVSSESLPFLVESILMFVIGFTYLFLFIESLRREQQNQRQAEFLASGAGSQLLALSQNNSGAGASGGSHRKVARNGSLPAITPPVPPLVVTTDSAAVRPPNSASPTSPLNHTFNHTSGLNLSSARSDSSFHPPSLDVSVEPIAAPSVKLFLSPVSSPVASPVHSANKPLVRVSSPPPRPTPQSPHTPHSRHKQKHDFPWYSRRLGIFFSLAFILLSLDAHGHFELYTPPISDMVASLSTYTHTSSQIQTPAGSHVSLMPVVS